MWITIGIILGLFVIYKAFDGSIWAIILLVLALAGLSIKYWHYVSFALILLGISALVIIIGKKLIEGRTHHQKEEVSSLFAQQESTMMMKRDGCQVVDKDQSDSNRNPMSTGRSISLGTNDDLYAVCLAEMKYIEDVLLPMVNEMANNISDSYNYIAQTISDLADIAIDYSDGSLSEKGKRQVFLLGNAIAFGVSAFGEWKKQKEKDKQLAKLLCQKQEFARSHFDQIKKISPKLKKLRGQMKSLVEKTVIGVNYEVTNLMSSSYADQVRDNIGKTLALYRRTLYDDMLVDYLGAEYKAWLGGEQESSMEQVTMYDVNLVIVQAVYNSEDKLKADFMRLLGIREDYNERISGGDILLLSDLQIVGFGIINNGGKTFENELLAHNAVVKHYLCDNQTYVDYTNRYRSYNEIVSKAPKASWKWLLSVLPITLGVVYKLCDWLMLESWQLIASMVAVVLVFLALFSSDLENRRYVYGQGLEKLQIINKRILRNIIGYSFKRKEGYTAPTNIW